MSETIYLKDVPVVLYPSGRRALAVPQRPEGFAFNELCDLLNADSVVYLPTNTDDEVFVVYDPSAYSDYTAKPNPQAANLVSDNNQAETIFGVALYTPLLYLQHLMLSLDEDTELDY